MSTTTDCHPLGMLKAQYRPSFLLRVVSWMAAVLLAPFGIGAIVAGLDNMATLADDPVKIGIGLPVVLLSAALPILALQWTRFRLQLREHGLSYRSLLRTRQIRFDDLTSARRKSRKTSTFDEAGSSEYTSTSYWLSLTFSDERRSCLKIVCDQRAFNFSKQVVQAFRAGEEASQ